MNASSAPASTPPPISLTVAKNSPISNSATSFTTTAPTTLTTSATAGVDYLSVWSNSTNEEPTHKKEIDEFRAALQSTFRAHPDQELVREAMMLDNACLRFLRARHYAVDKAVQHFKRALQVRLQQHIDAVLLGPFITAAAFNRILCRGFHGYDRAGRPIYVERIGCIDVDMVNTAMTLQQRLAFCRYQAEYIRKIEFPRASARLGKRIDQVVILVDMRGFNRHHIRPSQYTFIHALTSNDSLLYPERLAYTVLINVPTVFSLVWRVVSAWMDAQMRAKFFLFSTDEADKARFELTKRIDPSMLPACMGGTCKCGPISQPSPPHKAHESIVPRGGDGGTASTTITITTANSVPPHVTTSAQDGTTTSVSTSTSTDILTTTTTTSFQSSAPSAQTSSNPSAVSDVVAFYNTRATNDSPSSIFPPTVATTATTESSMTTATATPLSSSSTPTTARTQAAAGRSPAPVAIAVAAEGGSSGGGRRGSAPVVTAAPATALPAAAATNKRASLPSSSSSGFFTASKSATASSSSSLSQKRSGGPGGGSGTNISGPVSGHVSAYRWDPDSCLTNSRENRQFLEFCQHGLGIHTAEQAALVAAAAAAQAPAAPGDQISREDETRIAASVEHAEHMDEQPDAIKH